MKIGIVLLLNTFLLVGLIGWLRAEHRRAGPQLRRWLLPALAWRLLFTGISSAWPNLDMAGPAKWGRWLAAEGLAHPGRFWQLMQGTRFAAHGEVVAFYQWSNTLFFYKLFAWLGLASGGVFWLSGLYLSIGCFMLLWTLVRTLGRVLPATPAAAGSIAFLLWPPVVWWTAGLTKETVLVGAEAGLVALVLPLLYERRRGPRARLLGRLALGLVLAWVALRMRYFFALPLLGSLLALVGATWAQRRGWLRASWPPLAGALLGGLVLVGAAVVLVGGEPVSQRFVTTSLWENYVHANATSAGRPHLAYAGLQPTVGSMLQHFPLAAAQTLTRPWLGESAAPLYLAAGLENLGLLGLLVLAAVAVGRGRPGRLPPALALALLLYCLVLAGLIGLSTPNLGTLHRYRAALLPWLLWLLLQNDYARQLLKRFKLE